MKKAPKPQRARRGKKYIGNWFILDPATGAHINLGTKDAGEALARSREFAKTGKRNFQDDLDAAAEKTVAAVEAAPAESVPAGIEAPAAPPPPPPEPAAPAAAPPPQPPAPAPAPISGTYHAPGWADDANAAAGESAAAGDAAADPSIPSADINPDVLDDILRTGAEFTVWAQLAMQAKIVEWRTGTKPPPIPVFLEQHPKLPEMLRKAAESSQTGAVDCWLKFYKRKFPLDTLPDWAGALILTGGLSSIQFLAAKVTAMEEELRKRGGAPPAAPPAPEPTPAETTSAEAL